jgi:hypothetical protein
MQDKISDVVNYRVQIHGYAGAVGIQTCVPGVPNAKLIDFYILYFRF